MYYDQHYECMPREELKQLQLERLQSTLTRVARNVPFYRAKFDELGVDPDEFRSLDDLSGLPFTTKADLRENYPYGMFAVPMREVVRLHTSSGSTGRAVIVGYSRNDVDKWSDLAARVLVMAGVTRDDVVQIAFGYGLFTGGFGFHYGAERLGASVVPASGGNTRRQMQIIQDYKTTTLVCTPGYAMHLARAMFEAGVNPNSLTLKHGLFGAECWSEDVRADIEEGLKLTATDNYGLSEIMGPGVAGECLERNGLHIGEDHFLAEIIDPETLQPVPTGRTGELVLTTLTKEAFPMIRFRTGDLTTFIDEPCPCGRTFIKIGRIQGRTDDMFILRGVNVYPSEVERILTEIDGVEPCFRVELTRKDAMDQALVYVALGAGENFDEVRKHQSLQDGIERRLESELGVSIGVRLVEHQSLLGDDKACKFKRVVDNRAIDGQSAKR